MSKNFIFKMLLAAAALAVAVLWLVSMFVDVPLEGGFNIYWGIAILGGAAGILFVVRGVLSKGLGVLKKLDIALGAAFLVSAVLAIIKNYTSPGKYAFPLIAIGLTAALLLGVLATKGKAWDQGDNQKPGYKNYYQRKAEQEEKERLERESKNQNSNDNQ